MTDVRIRPIDPAELPEAVDVYLTARADMQTRQGMTPPAADRPYEERNYRHILRSGVMRVAEVDGRIGGVCHAVVRDRLWFLSGFWVRPDLQRQGVGGPLLQAVWDAGRERGAETHFVWSSINTTAMGAYMKKGMLPGYQILTFSGRVSNLPAAPAEGFDEEELPLSTVTALDERVRGTAREVDHLFWQTLPGMAGRLVTQGGRPAGYYYRRGGLLGPVAWLDPAHAEAVLALAVRDAATHAEEIRLIATGATPGAIRFALGAGLRLTSFSHFLTTAPFGAADRYLPSGPLLY